MRRYHLAAILSLALRAYSWPQHARDALADLAEEFDPSLTIVGELLRVQRPPLPELPSTYWSFAAADRTVHA